MCHFKGRLYLRFLYLIKFALALLLYPAMWTFIKSQVQTFKQQEHNHAEDVLLKFSGFSFFLYINLFSANVHLSYFNKASRPTYYRQLVKTELRTERLFITKSRFLLLSFQSSFNVQLKLNFVPGLKLGWNYQSFVAQPSSRWISKSSSPSFVAQPREFSFIRPVEMKKIWGERDWEFIKKMSKLNSTLRYRSIEIV